MVGLQLDPAAAEQLRHGDEFVTLLAQGIDGAQRPIHAGGVEVVHQNDRAVIGFVHNVLMHGVCVAVLPVQRVDAPADHRTVDVLPDRLAVFAVGDAHDLGVLRARLPVEIRLDGGDLAADLRAAQRGELGVTVGVVRRLAAQRQHALDEGAVAVQAVGAVFAAHEEGRHGAALLQLVQQPAGLRRGAVVEGEGDQLGRFVRGPRDRERRERQQQRQREQGAQQTRCSAFHIGGLLC